MGADAELCGLLEVEQDGGAGVVTADGNSQEVTRRAWGPGGARIDRPGVVHAQKFGKGGGCLVLVLALCGGPQGVRRQCPADALGQGRTEVVGAAGHRRWSLLGLARFGGDGAQVLDENGSILLDRQAQGRVTGLVETIRDEIEDCCADCRRIQGVVGNGQR